MNYDELYATCMEMFPENTRDQYTIYRNLSYYAKEARYSKDICLFNVIALGGASGGSCWEGSEAEPYTNPIEKDTFPQLIELLKNHFSHISFANYLEILEHVVTNEYSVSEYYGNYTDYLITYIKLSDLLKVMLWV